ncbi:MAG: precorrin-8X methylmutase [Lachnospiraceae bacterium]|nr:precorrin-8X methylmutase [Lachnospiraceae bacterium]
METLRPDEIEKRSFEIIQNELKAQNISVPLDYHASTEEELSLCRSIIVRCIHTTADFDYAGTLRFSPDSVNIIRDLIREGADIVTDTNMALTGINKDRLASFGGSVHCFMADSDVAREAKERGETRAYVAMEKAIGLHNANPDKKLIFAIGNAPTALISLHKSHTDNIFTPDFIIGVPVGFVNVVASKELIMASAIPCIVNEGNKGGSPVAAAIINAVLKSL